MKVINVNGYAHEEPQIVKKTKFYTTFKLEKSEANDNKTLKYVWLAEGIPLIEKG